MPGLCDYLKGIRLACFLFMALACLATACASAIPPATPTPTLVPATVTPAATATVATTATPAAAATATAVDLAPVLDSAIQDAVRSETFSGSVLVAQNGHVILSKGYGLADQAKKTPNTPQTKFRIYSDTKQFTAMAIMLLQVRGKLSVQDKICQYLTDCPGAWQAITIHHLLTHTSGISNTADLRTKVDLTSPLPLEQMIAAAKALPLQFQPGTMFSYVDMGYILLGKIIEAVSGQTYETFLKQNIFGPLQMTSTDYDFNRPDVAAGYSSPGVMADPVNMWVPFSAGGLDSTVGDLYLWDQALYTDTLVSQKMRDAIFTPYVADTDFPGFGYGYGWIIGPYNGRRVDFHFGGNVGFKSEIVRFPDDKTTIILLSNLENADEAGIVDTLSPILFAR